MRLQKLLLLPLMYIYELHDILFFIKSLKEPSHAFQITNWIKFCKTSTRSAAHSKLIYNHQNSNLRTPSFLFQLPSPPLEHITTT